MSEYVVYVLYSDRSNRLYIGFSSAIIERFHWHNEFSRKGYTVRYRPWKIVHVEFYNSKKEAMDREKQLKGGQGREWIKKEVLPNMLHGGFISA